MTTTETRRFDLLINADVKFGGDHDVQIKDKDEKWTLGLNIDRTAEELIFSVQLEPDYWLAVGLADDLMGADVIQWEAGATGYNPADSPNSLTEEMLLREQSKVHDRISVHGVLLENKANQLRNFVHLDDHDNQVHFTTWRLFDTSDPLDSLIAIEGALPLAIASGKKTTEWEQRTNYGRIDLFLHSQPIDLEMNTAPVALAEDVLTLDKIRVKEYEAHGWWCLIAWFPLGFALLATQRYYKTHWYWMFHSHNILGLFVTLVTVWSCFDMHAFHNWKPTMSVHSVLGMIALALVLLAGGSGIVTAFMMQFYKGDPEWAERDKVYNVAKAHRYISYIMLLWGNSVVTGGCWTYLKKIGFDPWGPICLIEITFFGLLWTIHECCLRRYNRHNFKIIEGDDLFTIQQRANQKTWTPAQIEEAVAKGDTLCVCDNLVLRTDGYEKLHPGGKFVIYKNFGRDIAKFYYGNYSLTNGKLSQTHTHSGQANAILHSMIVGTIEDQHDATELPTKIFAKHKLTENIATFTFKSLDAKPVRNFKGWYQDLGMVAKHFTVSSGALPHIKRQYTICQTMEVHIVKALYKLAKDIIEGGPGSQIRLDDSLFDGNDKNEISLTLKNYKRPNGVATQIFDVELVNYQNALDQKDNFLVATRFSSNIKESMMKIEEALEAPNKNIMQLQTKGMNPNSFSLAPTKLVSTNTGDPGITTDVVNFDSDKGLRKNPNVSFAKVGALGSNSPSPMKDFKKTLPPLEKVQEEVLNSSKSMEENPDNPETCPEPPNDRSADLTHLVRQAKKSNSDVESQLELQGIKLRDSELEHIASDDDVMENIRQLKSGNEVIEPEFRQESLVGKKSPLIQVERGDATSESHRSYEQVACEQNMNDVTPQPPQRVHFALGSPREREPPSSDHIELASSSMNKGSEEVVRRGRKPTIAVKELGRPSLSFDEEIQLRNNLTKDSALQQKPNASANVVAKPQADLMVLPEDEQRAFEAKMDQFLLQENLPKVLTENEQSAQAAEESEQSDASNYQSQNSQVYSQQSMPFFLQQIQNSVAIKAHAKPPKEMQKKMTLNQNNNINSSPKSSLTSQLSRFKSEVNPSQLLKLPVPVSSQSHVIPPQRHPQSILKRTMLAPPAQRQSFFQKIGLLRSTSPRMQHSITSVKRSWTKIANHGALVLKDIDENDLVRRNSIFTHEESFFDVFNIKGPMGKGLCIEESGVHVAFCAGTGVLVFLDLVSHLLLRAYYKHYVEPSKVPKHMTQLKDDFTFLFYVSMLSMDSEIGLNICEALEKVNRKLGETNFKLKVRISKRWDGFRGEVWDEKFVDDNLSPHAGNIRKVWISGPPGMNESLDKAFDKLASKLGVHPHMIDAM